MTQSRRSSVQRIRTVVSIALAAAALLSTTLAADPPAQINYQGVLRNASDKPQSGTFDMTFRFFDALTGGNEIMIDAHTGGGGNAVAVSGGLFNVALGGGTVSDGSGPGFYSSLSQLFGDYSNVYMAIQVGAETLSPRVRVLASAYALNAGKLQGQTAGNFVNTSDESQTKTGHLYVSKGVDADSEPSSGYAVAGRGTVAGGQFQHVGGGGAGIAYVGVDSEGISASGDYDGGSFRSSDGSSFAYAASSPTYVPTAAGIEAYSSHWGGYFQNTSTGTRAYLGTANTAVYGDAHGPYWGARFQNTDTPYHVSLGTSSNAIEGQGHYCGGEVCGAAGFFWDENGGGSGYLAVSAAGMIGYGSYAGGQFRHGSVGSYDTWGDVGRSGYTVVGNGVKSFTQNHPYRADRSVVFAALEGDEAGVYTRGSGQTVRGEARIALGGAFRLVANPDIGLTATVTPRGRWAPLYVESVSPELLVVRSDDPRNDVEFDYQVSGLRIGFEQMPVVQEKRQDAPIPALVDWSAQLVAHPELVELTPLERFKAMRRALGHEEIDLSRSQELCDAVRVGAVLPMTTDGAPQPSEPSSSDRSETPAAGPAVSRQPPLPPGGKH